MKMKKILEGVLVDKLLKQLEDHPDLWDQYTLRTGYLPLSPHREVSDIWLRYNAIKNLDPFNPESFSDEHESVWYPAIETLTEARKLIDNIVTLCGVDELGGCLITRIKPGDQVYPHNDAGHWHSEYYKDKYLLLLKANREQGFNYTDECHNGITGDLYIFDNRHEHWVENFSADTDRISLIIAGRKN